ncbi:glycosyltransferase family 31 protein [Mycena floridula]|nr:glycosyltransferase family 31 protein [Mycena floridula]
MTLVQLSPVVASSSRNLLDDGYDDSSSSDSDDTSRPLKTNATGSTGSPRAAEFLLVTPHHSSGRASTSTSASATPVPSRSQSPMGFYPSSVLRTSDTDSEISSPFLHHTSSPWGLEDRRRWWHLSSSRRRRNRDGKLLKLLKRWTRRLIRHPFFPQQPITILLTLILLSVFAISLTLLLMHILNPDKDPLPWRAYCSIPDTTAPPEALPGLLPRSTHPTYHPFPPENLDSLPPVGIFVGVFSVDSAFERRSLVRTTWASHPRSRNGAGDGDDGAGTSRTIVRFILGQPRKDWERRIKLEMEMYNDIVILPTAENMNGGKTHTFFSWASINAWVPPIYTNSSTSAASFSYSNYTSAPPPLAPHDSPFAFRDQHSEAPRPWVRPDYMVKVDDDAFLMLAELEARLRVEIYNPPNSTTSLDLRGGRASIVESPTDPLIYWGYLVTNRLHRFMAGELYALSWSIVDWVAKDPTVKGMTRGAEDKQTAKWMRLHPQASQVRWTSERCWIYDHPRAGTVYGHGFLFPSEVTRVKNTIQYPNASQTDSESVGGAIAPTPVAWSHSSVSTFGVRYVPPFPDLNPVQSVEALVEGSEMSMLQEDGRFTPEGAWLHREGRRRRYQGLRVGGTVVVHFIKKNVWYMETALALLEGPELTPSETFQYRHF